MVTTSADPSMGSGMEAGAWVSAGAWVGASVAWDVGGAEVEAVVVTVWEGAASVWAGWLGAQAVSSSAAASRRIDRFFIFKASLKVFSLGMCTAPPGW